MATSSWGAAWGLAFGAAWGALAATPQPLTQADIDAIVAACWAHPQGQAYLAKIYQIEALSIACGNPCCHGAYLPPAGKPPRFRPEPFVPAHIPYELLDRRRDDEDAFLLGVLL